MFERFTDQARQVVVLAQEEARLMRHGHIGTGNVEPGGQLPFTPAAHDALGATLRESLELGHDRVEPAHLLLGVLRQRDSVARRVLAGAGAHPTESREEVERRLAETTGETLPRRSPLAD